MVLVNLHIKLGELLFVETGIEIFTVYDGDDACPVDLIPRHSPGVCR